jgi:hypothetical protein
LRKEGHWGESMSLGNVKAEVITCPGRLGDAEYFALQINVDGFESPYVLTLRMPAIGARALSERIKPVDLYEAMAQAINIAKVHVEVLKAEERRARPHLDAQK